MAGECVTEDCTTEDCTTEDCTTEDCTTEDCTPGHHEELSRADAIRLTLFRGAVNEEELSREAYEAIMASLGPLRAWYRKYASKYGDKFPHMVALSLGMTVAIPSQQSELLVTTDDGHVVQHASRQESMLQVLKVLQRSPGLCGSRISLFVGDNDLNASPIGSLQGSSQSNRTVTNNDHTDSPMATLQDESPLNHTVSHSDQNSSLVATLQNNSQTNPTVYHAMEQRKARSNEPASSSASLAGPLTTSQNPARRSTGLTADISQPPQGFHFNEQTHTLLEEYPISRNMPSVRDTINTVMRRCSVDDAKKGAFARVFVRMFSIATLNKVFKALRTTSLGHGGPTDHVNRAGSVPLFNQNVVAPLRQILKDQKKDIIGRWTHFKEVAQLDRHMSYWRSLEKRQRESWAAIRNGGADTATNAQHRSIINDYAALRLAIDRTTGRGAGKWVERIRRYAVMQASPGAPVRKAEVDRDIRTLCRHCLLGRRLNIFIDALGHGVLPFLTVQGDLLPLKADMLRSLLDELLGRLPDIRIICELMQKNVLEPIEANQAPTALLYELARDHEVLPPREELRNNWHSFLSPPPSGSAEATQATAVSDHDDKAERSSPRHMDADRDTVMLDDDSDI